MELKSVKPNNGAAGNMSSNRTFMELKYEQHETDKYFYTF